MSDELLALIADMAVMYAKAHDVSIPVAVDQIKREVAVARAYYRRIESPYGDDDHGLVLWLMRPAPTPAA